MSDTTVAVVGLGYVGLPLAVEFGKKYRHHRLRPVATRRSQPTAAFVDPTGEVSARRAARSDAACASTTDPASSREADFIVVAVPTPVDEAHQPDFAPLLGASESVGEQPETRRDRRLRIDRLSGRHRGDLRARAREALGHEVEARLLRRLLARAHQSRRQGAHADRGSSKVVSGDTPETLERVAAIYGSIVTAGVHRASSIKVAEAAKVIENTQRDLNIALMNELALIFDRIGIDTLEVLEAAGTKWNFLPFRPGLVGGHCIGVDPYYLTHKADMLGYHPQVILAGRRINDGMGKFIAEQTVKQMIAGGLPRQGCARDRARA